MAPRLKERYQKEVVPALVKEFSYTNANAVPRLRKIIQVYGCYWHPHGACRFSHRPQSRLDYWLPKLEGNRKRDSDNTRRLRRQGWHVLVIRECQIGPEKILEERLASFLR